MTTTPVAEGGINYHYDGRREEGMAGGELTLLRMQVISAVYSERLAKERRANRMHFLALQS